MTKIDNGSTVMDVESYFSDFCEAFGLQNTYDFRFEYFPNLKRPPEGVHIWSHLLKTVGNYEGRVVEISLDELVYKNNRAKPILELLVFDRMTKDRVMTSIVDYTDGLITASAPNESAAEAKAVLYAPKPLPIKWVMLGDSRGR